MADLDVVCDCGKTLYTVRGATPRVNETKAICYCPCGADHVVYSRGKRLRSRRVNWKTEKEIEKTGHGRRCLGEEGQEMLAEAVTGNGYTDVLLGAGGSAGILGFWCYQFWTALQLERKERSVEQKEHAEKIEALLREVLDVAAGEEN